ncbi:hypothetical protein EUTSA_v10017728mg [Eutrema salsugineum]|uniref:UBA domain-containing protein n=1 Tax=Eutrema salsugineum TaxID=72664 RepID=V4NY68_EUTSA|nr:hypothetical protein EUTSA_v10017728mg [Eutrema salsugineum]
MKESTNPAQIGDENLSSTMDDRAKRICDECGVSREEAIYYLDGFLWDVDAAIEACRSQTLQLPSLTLESSPGNEKSAPEAPYKPPLMTDSRPSSSQPPNQLRNELIKSFCEAAFGFGATVEEAIQYLERRDWDPNKAFNCFFEERRRTPSQRNGKEVDPTGSLEEGGGEYIPEARPLMASTHVKIQDIQESTSLAQIKEGTLSPPMVSEESPEAQPSPTVSNLSMSSGQLPDSPEQPCQLKREYIDSFCEVANGASPKEAIACLNRCKGNLVDAISYFFENGSSQMGAWIPFRSDQTVRDIRNSVEALSPAANNRDYYFKSDTGVEYKDLNTTVHTITSGSRGSTTLHQLYYT